MTMTRSKVLAGVMALCIGCLAATAQSPKMKNVLHMQFPRTDGMPVCGFSQNTEYVPGFGYVTPCPYCDSTQPVTPAVAVPVQMDVAKLTPAYESPVMPTATMPVVPVIELPRPAPTVEPPLAVVPAVPVMELPKLEPVTPLPAVTEPKFTIPTAPRVVQVEALSPATFNRIMIDFNSKPLKFEVQSGETTLKVECDSMDVRMPGEQGTTATPLKATGHVKFSAAGCNGSCDELVIYTASGEAVLHGNVKLRCRQGKVETEITGTSVKFKLGAATASPVEIVPASR